MDYTKYIAVVEDFPKKGISFKDISPLLRNAKAFSSCIDDLAKLASQYDFDVICGPESRAFVFASALAYKMNKGFVMARKAGKLPGITYKLTYQLEYATATIEIPAASFKKGDKVLLLDDLMATGGTFKALKQLIENAGGEVVGALTVINLKDLDGAKNLGVKCSSLLEL